MSGACASHGALLAAVLEHYYEIEATAMALDGTIESGSTDDGIRLNVLADDLIGYALGLERVVAGVEVGDAPREVEAVRAAIPAMQRACACARDGHAGATHAAMADSANHLRVAIDGLWKAAEDASYIEVSDEDALRARKAPLAAGGLQ